MSIITGSELSTAEKQLQTKIALEQKSSKIFNVMVQGYSDIATIVFDNGQALTPQEVFESLGTDASRLLSLASTLVTAVNTAEADTLPTTLPIAVSVNQDGTVTVDA